MSRQRLRRFAALAGMALAVLVGLLSRGPAAWTQAADPDPCVAGQPCFTNVTDILNGRRHLLRTDDLVIAGLFTNIETGAILNTNDSQITSVQSSSLHLTGAGNSFSIPTVTGARMFDTPYDVAVSAVYDSATAQLAWYLDGGPGPIASGKTPISEFSSSRLLLSAAGDVTGDGFDDMIFFLAGTVLGQTARAVAATAIDPKDPSQGLKFGNELIFDISDQVNPVAIAVGTPGSTPQVLVLGNFICGLAIQAYVVDPESLALTSRGLFPLTPPEGEDACVIDASIAAGRFGTTTHDQVAVAYYVAGNTVKVNTVDFDAQGDPVQKAVFDTGQQISDTTPFLGN